MSVLLSHSPLESDCPKAANLSIKADKGSFLVQVRWQNTVAELQESLTSAVGDVIVAAGAIAYSGPFTPLYRASLLEQWTAKLAELGVPFSQGSNLISTLADPVATRTWAIAGLPTDSVSVENGAAGI